LSNQSVNRLVNRSIGHLIVIYCSFIHSGYFYSASSSPLLLKRLYHRHGVGVNTPKRNRQLQWSSAYFKESLQLQRTEKFPTSKHF